MWFDLTQEVQLPEKKYMLYKKLQTMLYVVAFLLAIIMALRVIFDSQNFYSSLTNLDSNKNTLDLLQYQGTDSPTNGNIVAGSALYFDTVPVGTFSKAVIKFPQDNQSQKITTGEITIRKSHQAFLYPEGGSLGFKDGTLLKNKSAYYIVSKGELRKFETSTVSAFGYPLNAFVEVTTEELQYNPAGQLVEDATVYPESSLFKIDSDYYILQNSQLKKFTSEYAFLSQYKAVQAIQKDQTFFTQYALADDVVGFSDGSLVSFGDSIYIISSGKYFPINNPETFIEKGYSWDDVIPAGSDEIALYEKTALFTIRRDHPNGTIFKTIESGKYFIVNNLKKQFLPSQNIVDSWSNRSPILVSEKSLETTSQCAIKKSFFGSYSCEIGIDNLQNLIGVNYEFIMKLNNDTTIADLNVSFKKDINRTNLMVFLRNIYNKITNKYVAKITPTQ
jgi:hypothetical protein